MRETLFHSFHCEKSEWMLALQSTATPTEKHMNSSPVPVMVTGRVPQVAAGIGTGGLAMRPE